MTRIVVMSDTHMLHRRLVVPDGDILVHCGDWTASGEVAEYLDFFAWFGAQPHARKVLVAGNHEKAMAEDGPLLRARMPSGITYLEDSGATIAGLKFWGSPRTVGYTWMAFTHRALDIVGGKQIWAKVPDDVDVLVTHGPPYGILDRNYAGQRNGDPDLIKRVKQVRPRLHLFGHVHDNNGGMLRFGTRFINAAIGDDARDPDLSDRLHVVDLA